jgi:hypothetical protein
MRIGLITVLPMVVALVACASSGTPVTAPANAESGTAPPRDGAEFSQAAATPLADLNLVRARIPPALTAARKAPYAPPSEVSCAVLAAEVEALDAALGADLDTPANTANPGLVERGGEFAGETAVGAVRDVAGGVMPFRSWVRRLSGAERHSREVAAAIAAGGIRRAYLKGLGQTAGCAAPAAPRR